MSLFGFGAKAAAWNDVKRKALLHLAIDAKNEFDENFDKEGAGRKKWKEVQRRIPGTQAYKRADADGRTRKILQGDTGQLSGGNEIGRVDSRDAIVYNDTPYADLQQNGGRNAKGSYVPPRPFMVQTPRLTATQLATLKLVTGETWQRAGY